MAASGGAAEGASWFATITTKSFDSLLEEASEFVARDLTELGAVVGNAKASLQTYETTNSLAGRDVDSALHVEATDHVARAQVTMLWHRLLDELSGKGAPLSLIRCDLV